MGKRWGLELSLDMGYVYFNHRKYEIGKCGEYTLFVSFDFIYSGNIGVDQDNGRPNNFIMTAKPATFKTKKDVTVEIKDAILLVRLAARFDFYNKVRPLTITEIVFEKPNIKSKLINAQDIDYSKGSVLYPIEKNKQSIIGEVYSYENLKPEAPVFTIKGEYYLYDPEYNEHSTAKVEKEINFVDAEGNPIKINRNHLYSIVITEPGGGVEPGKPDELNFEIIVGNWGEAIDIGHTDFDNRLVINHVHYENCIRPYCSITTSQTAIKKSYNLL